MADADRLGKIASIGQDLITTQLTMAAQTPSQALEGTWVLGYCFGIFDALAQQADLDDEAEGFSLITLGFLGLFADPADPEAAAFIRRLLGQSGQSALSRRCCRWRRRRFRLGC